jgi:hypothetical protein
MDTFLRHTEAAYQVAKSFLTVAAIFFGVVFACLAALYVWAAGGFFVYVTYGDPMLRYYLGASILVVLLPTLFTLAYSWRQHKSIDK